MNLRSIAAGNSASITPRFDAKFIQDNQLIERYLDNKLPVKGARDLEHWCAANPGYLDGLKLPDRAQASLKLLEASGRPLDLREPRAPWWQAPYLLIGVSVVAVICVVAFWALFGKYAVLQRELADTRTRLHQGPLVQPAAETSVHVAPDRAQGVDHARISVNSNLPQLVDLHIDMTYLKATQFRLVVDKTGQGRALIVNNMLKDSSGELRLTVNTTGLSVGLYQARIEAYPLRGNTAPTAEGWLLLDVH